MKKKSIVVVAAASAVILSCVASPVFVSGIQNRSVTGKIGFVKREKNLAKRHSQTLLEKILIYNNNRNTIVKSGTDAFSLTEEGGEVNLDEEGTRIMNSVSKEWNELYQLGVLPMNLDENQWKLYRENLQYSIQTYMNLQYDFVTVLSVSTKSEGESLEVLIEKETGKIIQFCLSSSKESRQKDYSIENTQEGLEKRAFAWGKYIGAKPTETTVFSEQSGMFSYEDGAEKAEYQILVSQNEVVFCID